MSSREYAVIEATELERVSPNDAERPSFALPATNLFYVYQLLAQPNINSCELLEFAGHLDHARLRRALELALSRHPVLNSTLRRGLFRSFRCEVATEPLPIELSVAQCSVNDPARLKATLRDNVWQRPFAVGTARPIRFHLIETETGSYLQIITARVFNDARAGYLLVRDIAEAYSSLDAGQTPRLVPAHVPGPDVCALLTKHVSWFRAFCYWLGAIWNLLADVFHRDGDMPLRRAERGATDFVKVEFPGSLVDDLRACAKARGATMHALLCLALYNVRRALAPDDRRPLRVLDNFCLRRFASANVESRYDTFVVPYTIRLPARASEEQILDSVRTQLHRLKSGEILRELYRIRIYAALGRFSPLRLSGALVARFVAKSNVVLSNPGPVPFDIARAGDVPITDFYNFSHLFPPSRLMLIFSTFRKVLRVVTVYDKNAFENGPQELVERLRQELERLSRSTPCRS